MKLKIDDAWELHNIVRTPKGLRTRNAFSSIATPTAGTVNVAGWTIESPLTSEPWHYIVEQVTTTLLCTLRVFTEEFVEVFNFPLGVLPPNPVITWGVANNQLMISSPAFSTTLYGAVGGGVISATKTLSIDETLVTLDIPNGHLCAFGERFAIAEGNLVFFNEARPDLDPRAFTSIGVVSFPGSIYDMFQGVDGQLYVFTSDGIFTMPSDSLSTGQDVRGTISRVPGIQTSAPRNACATGFGVAVLQRSSVMVLSGGSQKEIPIMLDVPRAFARVVDVEDLRLFGEVSATPSGFVVGFRGRRDFFIEVDLETSSVAFVSLASTALRLVGILRTRDGEALHLMTDRVLWQTITGPTDFDASTIAARACGRADYGPDDRPVVRRVVVSSDNVGASAGVVVDLTSATLANANHTDDVIIGTTLWSASGIWPSRSLRTTRLTTNKRVTEGAVEVLVNGGGRRVGEALEVELGGVIRTRKDKQV